MGAQLGIPGAQRQTAGQDLLMHYTGTQMTKGTQIRALITAALEAAGDKGCTRHELSIASGTRDRLTRWYLGEAVTKICIRAMTRHMPFIRYFSLQHQAAADAYVAKMDGKVPHKFYLSAESAQRLVDACTGGESGNELAQKVGLAERTIRASLIYLRDSGRLQVHLWPCEKGGAQHRAWPIGAQVPPKPGRKPRKSRKRAPRPRKERATTYQPRKVAAKVAVVKAPAFTAAQVAAGFSNATTPKQSAQQKFVEQEGRKTAKTRITVAPPPVDRFHVEQPEPFFSRPGYRPDFIGQDTQIARAYGETA